MLVLEGMQAGVSWNLVLNKEENFRKAFDGFEPNIVASYDDAKLEELCKIKVLSETGRSSNLPSLMQ